jgi:Nif-specific regulatory protein
MPTSPRETDNLEDDLPGIVGAAEAMLEVYTLTRKVAPTPTTVLLIGETGTGKEMVARAVHRLSARADGPYVRVNCGALAESLLESELFGHVKGAFTGAIDNKIGRFEAAHGGTIFLDEISSMSAKLQVKLLRVLQEKEFERVGESRTIRVDTRVVAATNQFLDEEIEAGRFRDDLYYRLNVWPINLPPLRERRDDIPLLAKYFLERHAEEHRCDAPELTNEMVRILQNYDWPGNVRELENYMERAVVLAGGKPLTPGLLAPPGRAERRWRPLKARGGDLQALIQQLVRQGIHTLARGTLNDGIVRAVEREMIEQVLQQCSGVQVTAAQWLGINRNTLHAKVASWKKSDSEAQPGEEPREDREEPPAKRKDAPEG